MTMSQFTCSFTQDEETQEWQNKVKLWKERIKQIKKSGETCIQQWRLNIKDPYYESNIIKEFEAAEDYMWNEVGNSISHYLTPDGVAQLQNRAQFKSKHSECEIRIAKLKKDNNTQDSKTKVLIKERDELRQTLIKVKQQLEKITNEKHDLNQFLVLQPKTLDETMQTKQEDYQSNVRHLQQRLNMITSKMSQYEGHISQLQQENESLRATENIFRKKQLDLQTTQKSREQVIKSQHESIKQLCIVREQLKVQNEELQSEVQSLEQKLDTFDQESQNSSRHSLLQYNAVNKDFQKKEEQYQNTIGDLEESLDCYVKQNEKNTAENLELQNIMKNYREALATQEKIKYGLQQKLSASEQEILELRLKTETQLQSQGFQPQGKLQTQKSTINYELPVYLDQKNSEYRAYIQQLEQELSLQKRIWEDDHVKFTQLQNDFAVHQEKHQEEIQYFKEYITSLQQELSDTNRKLDEKLGEKQWLTAKVKELEDNHHQKTTSLDNFRTMSLDDINGQQGVEKVQDPYITHSLAKVARIREEAEELEKEVEEFAGSKEDEIFLQLKEVLIRKLVKLDNVETEGHSIIRQKRKEAIQLVQNLLDILKDKTE